MKKGSITVFMGMNLMLLLSVFFTLLEVLHYRCLELNAGMVSDISVESAFADYNRPMWDTYGILAIDASYGGRDLDIAQMTSRMSDYMEDNAGIISAEKTKSMPVYLRMAGGTTEIKRYGLITDDDGVPFMQIAAKTQMYDLAEGFLDGWSGNMDEYSKRIEESPDIESLLNSGQSAIEEAEDMTTTTETVTVGTAADGSPITETHTTKQDIDSPIEYMKEIKERGWLALVMPEGRSLSEEAILSGDRVSERSLERGTLEEHASLSPVDRMLYLKFLTDHFTSFADEKTHGGAHYELEYVLAGKDSDKENLEDIVGKLMLAREAMNFASIAADGTKMAEAEATAATLVGFTLLPPVIEATKWGIVAAWALGESILDVRALLSGGKIALIKSPAEWTLTLTSFSEMIEGGMTAKECANGFTYEEYIFAALFLLSEKTLALRGMDVLEDALHRQEDYVNVRMDHMVYCIETDFTYEATPLFLSFVPILKGKDGGYQYKEQRKMSYLQEL